MFKQLREEVFNSGRHWPVAGSRDGPDAELVYVQTINRPYFNLTGKPIFTFLLKLYRNFINFQYLISACHLVKVDYLDLKMTVNHEPIT